MQYIRLIAAYSLYRLEWAIGQHNMCLIKLLKQSGLFLLFSLILQRILNYIPEMATVSCYELHFYNRTALEK